MSDEAMIVLRLGTVVLLLVACVMALHAARVNRATIRTLTETDRTLAELRAQLAEVVAAQRGLNCATCLDTGRVTCGRAECSGAPPCGDPCPDCPMGQRA